MFHGSMVALITPMHETGEIDYDSLRQLIDWHISRGTKALVVCGTTGESGTLSFDEKKSIIKHSLDQVKNRIPVIAGTNANRTEDAIELTQMAEEAGVDGCLIMTPAYIKPTQEGLYQHYSKIAKNVAVPQILYNVPGRTACDLLPETIARLSSHANIVAVKEATGSVNRVFEIKELCENFDVFSGDDFTARHLIQAGAKGVISVTANVVPGLFSKMCDDALNQEFDEAKRLDDKLQDLNRCLFLESNPIPVKWALHELGRVKPSIRLPLTPLSEEHRSKLQSAMKTLGILEE